MYLRPAMTLHGLAAGVTAAFVTGLVSMDCMNAWLGYRALFNSAYPTQRARKWEPKVVVGVGAPTVRTGDEFSRFSYPKKIFRTVI